MAEGEGESECVGMPAELLVWNGDFADGDLRLCGLVTGAKLPSFR
jgi:hypothetical protein